MTFREFITLAFSENGSPSSSRIISGWLSVSSMAAISFCLRHMMGLPVEKLQVWMGGLPAVILALATFAVSPYGVGKITGIFKKDKLDETQ
jgi:hypothetical protein